MAKLKLNEIPVEEKQEIVKTLFEILSIVDSKEDVINLLLGGLTSSEIYMLSKRINIAKLVTEGKSYRKIERNENVGSTTIKTVILLLNRNNHKFENILKKYFKKIYKNNDDGDFKFKKNRLYNYPGHELAMKILGIEYIDKMIQKKMN